MANYVSLLSPEYRRELTRTRKLKLVRTITAAVTAVLVAAAVGTMGLRIAGDRAVADVQAQNKTVQSQIAQMSVYEQLFQQKTALEGKIRAVRALDRSWIPSVGAIGKAIPEGVWLMQLGSGAVGEDLLRPIELQCGANRYEEVARTMAALRAIAAVEDVVCTASSETDGTVRFTLTVTFAASPADGGGSAA